MRLNVDVAIRVNGVLLTPEELELLLKLSEHGSMSKVAEEKGVTRSAVHKRIRNLEERLGCRLVESSPLGSYLTEHGRRIVIKYVNAKARLSRTETTVACSETVIEDVLAALGREHDVDVIVPPHEKMSRVEADVVVPDDPVIVFDRSDEAVGEPVVVRRTRLVRVGDGSGFVEVPGSAQRIYLTDLRNREEVRPKMRVGYYTSALEAVRNGGMWTVVPEELAPEGDDPGPHYTVMALPLTREGEDLLDALES
ncbi:helix-turn-helix domain-containing protein [Methanopyrus sp.]